MARRREETGMRGGRWLVSAMIGVVALVLYALPSAEATHLRTKYSDPDLQGLLLNPAITEDGGGFYQFDITDILATYRCCPKPDSDQGCKSPKPNHIQPDVSVKFNFGDQSCKNANRCNFNTQLLTLREVAYGEDVFDPLDPEATGLQASCPGTQVIRLLPPEGVYDAQFDTDLSGDITEDERVPEMAFKTLNALAVGVEILNCGLDGNSICDPDLDCPADNVNCVVRECFNAFFGYPASFSSIKNLPMDGNFKNDAGIEQVQLSPCECLNCRDPEDGVTYFQIPPPLPQ